MENETPSEQLGVGLVVLAGHLIVTLPVLIFMCGFSFIGLFFFLYISLGNFVWFTGFLLLGFIIGWAWWSLLIPRWRSWAHSKGVPPDELHKWAVRTGLVWPKGWIFEKTEYKWNDDK